MINVIIGTKSENSGQFLKSILFIAEENKKPIFTSGK